MKSLIILCVTVVSFVCSQNLILAQDKKAEEKTKPTSIAHIRISGSLGEGVAIAEPLFSSMQETLKDKIDRIKKASTDSTVKGLLLEIDGVDVGWGKLDELTEALNNFKKSGKKIYSYLEAGEMKDYLLALSSDKIILPESGWLMLTGLRAEVTFYKEMLEKIGAQADFLKVGDFKSAIEPYTRTTMSESSRKQMESMLDDFYEKSIVARIKQERGSKKWAAEDIRKIIDNGPYTAKKAAELGLVDMVGYFPSVTDAFKKELKVDDITLLKNYGKNKVDEIDFSNPFALLKLFATPTISSNSKPKIAVIYATGAINTGKSEQSFLGSESCGSTSMIQAIKQAENDKSVKAIVLRVDSPGGSALASDLIWAELMRCKKPIIASMSDVAASGGYYICMAASKIYAEPGTITGSIGVFGGKINMGGTYAKLGITSEVITRGANANLFSSTSSFSKSEREAMTKLIDDCYDQFLTKALTGREKAGSKLDRKTLEGLAGGRVWTGRQAKANGLIDELGTMQDAIKMAAKLGGLPANSDPELLLLPKGKSFLDSFLEPKTQLSLKSGLDISGVTSLFKEVKGLDSFLRMRNEPLWLMLPYNLQVK
ncbi:MAG: signal peptide peptidase SppA [Gemmataceae bacterium]|nr:signal peptide peptidase SppA [Gemmataceae bacterium]